jgi:hypothetical protein
VLDAGIRDHFQFMSDSYRESRLRSLICSGEFSTQRLISERGGSVGLNLPMAEGVLGFTGSGRVSNQAYDERRQTFCSGVASRNVASDYVSANRQAINTTLVHAWRSCAETYLNTWLNDRNRIYLSIVPTREDMMEFSMFIRHRPLAASPVTIINIPPVIQCATGDRVTVGAGTQIGQNEFSLNCRKLHDVSTSVFIELAGSGVSNFVELPAAVTRIDELRSEIMDLRGQLNSLRARLRVSVNLSNLIEIHADNPQHPSYPRSILTHERKVCPEGHYVRGVRLRDAVATGAHDGAGYAISGVTLLCAPLGVD